MIIDIVIHSTNELNSLWNEKIYKLEQKEAQPCLLDYS